MHTDQLLHAGTTELALGSYYEVYRELGYGFLESPYTNSMAVELGLRGATVRREVPTQIIYKGVQVGHYRFDLLVNDKVIVEVKAQTALTAADEIQVLNYLKASNIEVALLLNFGPKPEVKRLVFANSRKHHLEYARDLPRAPRAPCEPAPLRAVLVCSSPREVLSGLI